MGMVDTIKFGLSLWLLTYIGSWFNMLTLLILAWIVLFSTPKLYQQNQAQVDEVLGQVMAQVDEVKGKVPSDPQQGCSQEGGLKTFIRNVVYEPYIIIYIF